MRYYERTYDHNLDRDDKFKAQSNADHYKNKYLTLRKEVRNFVRENKIKTTPEFNQLIGLKK